LPVVYSLTVTVLASRLIFVTSLRHLTSRLLRRGKMAGNAAGQLGGEAHEGREREGIWREGRVGKGGSFSQSGVERLGCLHVELGPVLDLASKGILAAEQGWRPRVRRSKSVLPTIFCDTFGGNCGDRRANGEAG